MTHPCLSCGACCASFRVDFSVHESQEHGGRVPAGLVSFDACTVSFS
jgi:Fe-S-cluster containining protein